MEKSYPTYRLSINEHLVFLKACGSEKPSFKQLVSLRSAFDPAVASGSSPKGYNYDVKGIDADVAKYYIKLPDFHRYIPFDQPLYPFAPRIRHNPDGISLVVNSKGADVEFMFGDRMECTGARIVQIKVLHKKSPDEIEEVFYTGQKKDEAALADGVRYWDGEKWVAEPTVNRSYLRHVKAHNDILAGKGK